jgi:hypothetical protein
MNKKILTQKERLQFTLPPQLDEILIGLLLGDLYMINRSKSISSVILFFTQGLLHKDYLMHLFDLFKIYCNSAPKIPNTRPDKRTGKNYKSVRFYTISLPCFKELYESFYPEGKKIVPSNIGELLTLRGLAYWIADDGYWCGNGVHLCTESFTIEEVNLLVKTLTEKFNLECSLNKRSNSFRIRISSKSIPKLQNLLAPHMPSMMRYKIGL